MENISISRIKAYRAATGCSLKEAHEAILSGREVPTHENAEKERHALDRMHDERLAMRAEIARLTAALAEAEAHITDLTGRNVHLAQQAQSALATIEELVASNAEAGARGYARAVEDAVDVAERYTESCQGCAGVGHPIRALAKKEAGE